MLQQINHNLLISLSFSENFSFLANAISHCSICSASAFLFKCTVQLFSFRFDWKCISRININNTDFDFCVSFSSVIVIIVELRVKFSVSFLLSWILHFQINSITHWNNVTSCISWLHFSMAQLNRDIKMWCVFSLCWKLFCEVVEISMKWMSCSPTVAKTPYHLPWCAHDILIIHADCSLCSDVRISKLQHIKCN